MPSKSVAEPTVLPELLTINDLADLLKVPVGTVYTWRKFHRGPRGFFIGRSLRFTRADVAAWLDEQRRTA